jgi:hypothetical protein
MSHLPRRFMKVNSELILDNVSQGMGHSQQYQTNSSYFPYFSVSSTKSEAFLGLYAKLHGNSDH